MMKKTSLNQNKEQIKRIINVDSDALITDFAYNHNGLYLAVSDSDGNVFIYNKNGDNYTKTAQFRADQAAIWKISWSDPIFGQLLAVGSFKKKVAVFQHRVNNWTQVAFHQLHDGSVNHVQWAPAAYGPKLYSTGSDGKICILQLRKNNWQTLQFQAHDYSINSLAIKPIALNQQNQGLQHLYPTIATVGKDMFLHVWRHNSQAKFLKLKIQKQDNNQFKYHSIFNKKIHGEQIRTVLFRPIWNDTIPVTYSIITCSQDGTVKVSKFKNDQLQKQYTICEFQDQIMKVSQSLTGKQIAVSISSNTLQKNIIYTQKDLDQWVLSAQE